MLSGIKKFGRRPNLHKEWTELTPTERREERFRQWLSPADAKFASKSAEKAYQQRVKRLIDVIKLNEPDRVPVMYPITLFPAYYAKSKLQQVMYDYNLLRKAWLKFIDEIQRFVIIFCDFYLITFLLQDSSKGANLFGLIIYDKNFRFHSFPSLIIVDPISRVFSRNLRVRRMVVLPVSLISNTAGLGWYSQIIGLVPIRSCSYPITCTRNISGSLEISSFSSSISSSTINILKGIYNLSLAN